MATLKNLQNLNMNLVLSTDAKPRLKWTPDLHLRFLEAVNQLGGAEKATPKSLMKVMAIPGLTLYHLKSHLQKFRLGKSQPSLSESQSQSHSQASIETKPEDYKEIQSSNRDLREETAPINESFQITQALQIQMEVQRKLHHQIEVQRRLQLRIEAQGRYLQSVLKKAQETLSGYNPSPLGIELAKAELSRLVSMVNNGCQSSSISELTELGLSSFDEVETTHVRRGTVCSVESSLTSSESSEKNEPGIGKSGFVELQLIEQRPAKRSKTATIFDLNRQYQHEFESSPKAFDLNFCKGI